MTSKLLYAGEDDDLAGAGLAAGRDEEPRRVRHGLLAIAFEHKLADVDPQPVLADVLKVKKGP